MTPINPVSLLTGLFLPAWLLVRPELGYGAKLCYALLLQYAWLHQASPTQKTIATTLNITPRHVANHIKELLDAHLITIEKTTFPATSHYTFPDHPWMHTSSQLGTTLHISYEEQFITDMKNTSSLETNGGDPVDHPVDNSENVNVDELIDGWNTICGPVGLPKVNEKGRKNPTLRDKIRLRLRENPELDFWRVVLTKLSKSRFHLGDNDRGWKADLFYLVRNNANPVKIYEGA